MISRTLTQTILCLVLILPVACKSAKNKPGVLAQVGDRVITVADFKKKLAEFNISELSQTTDKSVRDKILNDLIEREILLSEADRRKIEITKPELEAEMLRVAENYPGQEFEKMLVRQKLTIREWSEDLSRSLRLKKVFQRLSNEPVSVDEQLIKQHYETHKSEYEIPEQVRALHILLDSEQTAFEILAQLRKGTKFETIARERSLGPEAQKGGDLGYFSRGVMPKVFDDAIFPLKVGKISRVVSSDYGYHIFKLVDRRIKRMRAYEECRGEIMEALVKKEKQQHYANWLEKQLKNTKILKNHELLAAL